MRGTMSLSFPPVTRAIKMLLAVNVGMYVLRLLLEKTGAGQVSAEIAVYLGLIPEQIVQHGWIWQLLTYSIIHAGFFHLFFNMLMLWMFGANLEIHFGSRQFLEFFFFGVLGGALTTVLLAYTTGLSAHPIFNIRPDVLTVGASGGIFAIYMACAMLFGEQQVYLFPFPFAIKMKYLVLILGFIALIGALDDRVGGGTANIAHLGGLLFGYLYLKFIPRRGLTFAFSEGFFGIRNSYHRWKRRKAAKKFEVYMRKHEKEPNKYFDEYGNFRPPDDPDKKDGGRGGWVN
ncbi:MAG TPA: rhomboid family intramembrane serine protease [Candidatus Solibacter sp.]|jgi:membrane associated rhomboid family serine protease|nr:rhomboid family intramembrane serine protease [Candidatus Solibacter sp.]